MNVQKFAHKRKTGKLQGRKLWRFHSIRWFCDRN